MAIGRIPEPGTGIPESIIAAKGDLIVGTANDTPGILSVGTNGHTLVADSSVSPTGLKWAAPAGGGKVLQVVQGTTTTSTSTTSSTFQDTTITASITPSSASSKILVISTVSHIIRSATLSGVGLRLVRGATAISTFANNLLYTDSGGGTFLASSGITYLDDPNTTSATTYKIQFRSVNGTNSVGVQDGSNMSTIQLLEIGA